MQKNYVVKIDINKALVDTINSMQENCLILTMELIKKKINCIQGQCQIIRLIFFVMKHI